MTVDGPLEGIAAWNRRLGVALGGGGALGLAHIGVLTVLRQHGIEPHFVAGTSIGAIVGACYVFGKLDELEATTRGTNWRDLLSLADVQLWKSGLLAGDAVSERLREIIGDVTFEEAERPFAVVAADLAGDREVAIRSGPVVDGIRASISLPGIFVPVERDGGLLIDGGMKNPLPVSVCQALGADCVIAVDVTGDFRGQAAAAGIEPGVAFTGSKLQVVTTALAMIMKDLARARFQTDPPDVVIVPKVGHMKQYEFNRADSLIDAGRDAALAALAQIQSLSKGAETPTG